MQEQTSYPRGKAPYARTDTPGIYKRVHRYVASWHEDGHKRQRSFPTYEAACAFRRDFILPYRERRALPPTVLVPGRRGDGWVYAFQAGPLTGPIKLGWSSDPARRLRDLSVAQPNELHLVALLPGDKSLERRLHDRLSDFRLSGEWFSCEILHKLIEV